MKNGMLGGTPGGTVVHEWGSALVLPRSHRRRPSDSSRDEITRGAPLISPPKGFREQRARIPGIDPTTPLYIFHQL